MKEDSMREKSSNNNGSDEAVEMTLRRTDGEQIQISLVQKNVIEYLIELTTRSASNSPKFRIKASDFIESACSQRDKYYQLREEVLGLYEQPIVIFKKELNPKYNPRSSKEKKYLGEKITTNFFNEATFNETQGTITLGFTPPIRDFLKLDQ